MRRLITLFAIVALGLVIACGGGDDDDSSEDTSSAGSGDSTSSSSSDSSGGPSDAGSSSSGGSKDNFCTPEYTDAVFEGFDPLTDLDSLEAAVGELNNLLDRWADEAPSEISGDVGVIVDALRGFFEILEENDYDFMAIATSASDDPRFLALDSDAFQAATDRLSEYCGYDIDPPQAPGPDLSGRPGAPGGLPEGDLPDDFPEALIPPDSEIEFAGLVGPGLGAQFTSTATFDQVIAFYEDTLGDATVTSDESTIWSIFEDGALTTVTVLGTDGDVEIGIALVTP